MSRDLSNIYIIFYLMHFSLINVFFKASVSVLTKKFYSFFKKKNKYKTKNENFQISSYYYISGIWCMLFVRIITFKPFATDKLTVEPYTYSIPAFKKNFNDKKPKII